MITMRGGGGLGDAIYVAGVARYFVERGQELDIRTNYAEVFRPLNGHVTLRPFKRERCDRIAHYSKRRGVVGTDQFQDCCIEAGISEPVEFRLDWQPQNQDLIARLRQSGKPIVVTQMPRPPWSRSDGYGAEFLPDCKVIQRAIDHIKGKVHLVQIGSGAALFEFNGIDCDLANKTSVSDLMDVGHTADGFLGFCSFSVPLAESLGDKPALLIWSRRGLNSSDDLVRKITPRKVLHGRASQYVIDDCSESELNAAVDQLVAAMASRRPLQG